VTAEPFDIAREVVVTDQEPKQIDRVCAEITQRTRARTLLVVAPRPRRVGIDQPVLQVAPANMVDLPEFARLEQLLCIPNRGDEPVVERTARGHVVARFARRLGHHVRVLERRRERFLAEDRRAGLEGGDRRFAMDVVRPRL